MRRPPGEPGLLPGQPGREVGHDAIIELQVDAEGEVWSGGRAVAVVTGTLDWPGARIRHLSRRRALAAPSRSTRCRITLADVDPHADAVARW